MKDATLLQPIAPVRSITAPMINTRWIALAAIVLPALAGLGRAGAQQPTQEQLKKQRDEKLALPVFKKAGWIFDYDQARAEAKKTGKPIFAYFSRSYAH